MLFLQRIISSATAYSEPPLDHNSSPFENAGCMYTPDTLTYGTWLMGHTLGNAKVEQESLCNKNTTRDREPLD